MTETLVSVRPLDKAGKKTVTPAEAERAAVRDWSRGLAPEVMTRPTRTGC